MCRAVRSYFIVYFMYAEGVYSLEPFKFQLSRLRVCYNLEAAFATSPVLEYSMILLTQLQVKFSNSLKQFVMGKELHCSVTETKTLLENMASFYLCYFAIISTYSTYTKTANYPGTKLVGVVFELRKRMKNSPSCAPFSTKP